MIGNDIVDLKLAKTQSNWQRNGFVTKIFTSQEQHLLKNSTDPFSLVWLLWSMKESAYKCYVQKKKIRFFAPKKLQCELISANQGLVLIDNERYYTHSKLTNNFIVTNASSANNDKIEQDHFKFDGLVLAANSSMVHQKLKKALSKSLNIPVEALNIKKNTIGIPKLYQYKKQLQVSISMSHHGNYGAYSILKINT